VFGRHAVRARGDAGAVMVNGYTTGVVLGAWSLTPAPAGAWALSAAVVRVAVPRGWLAATQDLSFQAPALTGGALWRVRALRLGDASLTATLAPPVPAV